MPIYAYRCSACGHAQDVLQKLSDPLLTVCPACGASAFAKQLTAAGFQLKGSGWYATDFRGGSGASGDKPKDGGSADADGTKSDTADKGATAAPAAAAAADKSADKPAAKPAAASSGGAGQ